VSLRYFNVFGPRQDPASLTPESFRFYNVATERSAAYHFCDGEQSRDFTYVDMFVEANLLAASRRRLPEK